MTDTTDATPVIEALQLIDRSLGELQGRELMASAQVADLLLDLRMLLAFVPAEPAAAV